MKRRTLALIVLVAMVALAGCGGGETTTAPEPGTATPTATETTESGPSQTTASETTQTADVDASTVQADALAAMDDVESYHVSSNTTVRQSANNQTQRQSVDMVGAFDRADRQAQINQSSSKGGGWNSRSASTS